MPEICYVYSVAIELYQLVFDIAAILNPSPTSFNALISMAMCCECCLPFLGRFAFMHHCRDSVGVTPRLLNVDRKDIVLLQPAYKMINN
tara:strand:+ start:7450 stop:7716 length:267 start_codon:yes stop_codon:yes gene_type:complete